MQSIPWACIAHQVCEVYQTVLKTVSFDLSHSEPQTMNNTVTVAEIKRRGMAAIEEGLRRGPLHIVKRNKPAAVVLSEDEYLRLANGKAAQPGLTALQWLLAQPVTGKRSKAEIDASLDAERAW